MPELTTPEYKGRGRRDLCPKPSTNPIQVSTIAKDTSIHWRTVILGEGAKGPIVAEVKIVRVIECRDKLPGKEIWLYIRRYRDGRIKYSLCNAPAETPVEVLNKAATMRWPIEQCFEECKNQLGMDHYETRSWPAWHRHMLFVFVAHLFTTKVRIMFKKNSSFNNATGQKTHQCCNYRT